MTNAAERVIEENRAYLESFKRGVRAAANDVTRQQMISMADRMSVRESDAFIAGYYAEKRRQRG